MEKTFHKSCQPLIIKIKAWRTMNKRELFQSDEEHVQKPDTNTAQRSKKPDAPLPRDGKRHSAVLFTIVLARTVRRREETEWVEWKIIKQALFAGDGISYVENSREPNNKSWNSQVITAGLLVTKLTFIHKFPSFQPHMKIKMPFITKLKWHILRYKSNKICALSICRETETLW